MSGAYAVIVAAGKGTRMGAQVNKVLLPLNGKPVLRRTAEAFCASDEVDGVCVVASKNEVEQVRQVLHGLDKVIAVVPGGNTRQQSVCCGLRALPEDA